MFWNTNYSTVLRVCPYFFDFSNLTTDSYQLKSIVKYIFFFAQGLVYYYYYCFKLPGSNRFRYISLPLDAIHLIFCVLLQLSEVFCSLVISCQCTYYGYLFARIKDKDHYQIATGCVKSGALSGMFVSGLLGQIVVYFNDSDYTSLPYYSLVGMIYYDIYIYTCTQVLTNPIRSTRDFYKST